MIDMDDLGGLNKRIHILKYAETVDEYGFTHQSYVDAIGNAIWARWSRRVGGHIMSSIAIRAS